MKYKNIRVTIDQLEDDEVVKTHQFFGRGYLLAIQNNPNENDDTPIEAVSMIRDTNMAYEVFTGAIAGMFNVCLRNGMSREDALDIIMDCLEASVKDFGMKLSSKTLKVYKNDNVN